MSFTERVNKSTILSQQAKLALGILSNECLTAKALTECLMSEPYGLAWSEALEALTILNKYDLLEMHSFTVNADSFNIDTRLTFAHDWVLKL